MRTPSNLPPGVTDAMIERAAGSDVPETIPPPEVQILEAVRQGAETGVYRLTTRETGTIVNLLNNASEYDFEDWSEVLEKVQAGLTRLDIFVREFRRLREDAK